jgi:hypothetical protein
MKSNTYSSAFRPVFSPSTQLPELKIERATEGFNLRDRHVCKAWCESRSEIFKTVKPVIPYANVDGHGIDDRDRELGVCKEMML